MSSISSFLTILPCLVVHIFVPRKCLGMTHESCAYQVSALCMKRSSTIERSLLCNPPLWKPTLHKQNRHEFLLRRGQEKRNVCFTYFFICVLRITLLVALPLATYSWLRLYTSTFICKINVEGSLPSIYIILESNAWHLQKQHVLLSMVSLCGND